MGKRGVTHPEELELLEGDQVSAALANVFGEHSPQRDPR